MSHNAEHAPREHAISVGRRVRPPGVALVPQGERDKLALRLQGVLSTFVDSPRRAVEEADAAFDDVVTQFIDTLVEQRRVLRTSWEDPDTDTQTEELRLALQQYREITERLLQM
ncbi:hypothetical protein [Streptomyces sp. NBC_01483]|uniref:hypothetical protein n=1 Tax=Streptomyces sp. NBC_01483 TaxID=2903883 RepID=UPI002E2FE727|nr:hypothetical protein [Streptomyces sp. NBC_01483]